jgi:hypothetical protein
MADVDGMDPSRAAGQQHLAEAAGRGADIETDGAARVDGEVVQGMGQLDPATRHPGMVLAGQPQRAVAQQNLGGLAQFPAFGLDQAGSDQRLRPGPALGQPANDEKLVGAQPVSSRHDEVWPSESRARDSRPERSRR